MSSYALRDTYMDALWQNGAMWGSWPIPLQDISLGTYGQTSGHTFEVLGNVRGEEFEVEMTPYQVQQPPAALHLASSQLTTKVYEFRSDVWVEVPELNSAFEGETAIGFESRAGNGFVAVFDAITHFTVGQDGDTRGFLRSIWPRLQESRAWSQQRYMLVADVYYAASAIVAGGVAKGVSFTFSARRGIEIADLLDGSITANIDIKDASGTELTLSTYETAPPAAIGFGLWLFDSHGDPTPFPVPR